MDEGNGNNVQNEQQPLLRLKKERNLQKIALVTVLSCTAIVILIGFVLAVNNTNVLSGYNENNNDIYTKLSDNRDALNGIRDELTDTKHITYVRWGHGDCPNGTKTVYSGFAASTSITNTRPTAGSQCLPEPQLKDIKYYPYDESTFGNNTTVYTVHGMSYNTFLLGKSGPWVACALCVVTSRSSLVVLPATYQCDTLNSNGASWTEEYTGYLMLISGAGPEYYCVDTDMQQLPQEQQISGVAEFVHIATGENIPESFNSKYRNTKVLSCVVCTM